MSRILSSQSSQNHIRNENRGIQGDSPGRCGSEAQRLSWQDRIRFPARAISRHIDCSDNFGLKTWPVDSHVSSGLPLQNPPAEACKNPETAYQEWKIHGFCRVRVVRERYPARITYNNSSTTTHHMRTPIESSQTFAHRIPLHISARFQGGQNLNPDDFSRDR